MLGYADPEEAHTSLLDGGGGGRSRSRRVVALAMVAGFLVFGSGAHLVRSLSSQPPQLSVYAYGLTQILDDDAKIDPQKPQAQKRCEHVIERTITRNFGKSLKTLQEQFALQSTDANYYYRGVAYLFWEDFVTKGWGEFNLTKIVPSARLADGSPLSRTSTWTWITGDQHLSNFGAWKNRHGEVVFSVNDFDEAVIYDFQMDIWRVAVSIFDHAITLGLNYEDAAKAVVAFTDEYVGKVKGYLNNEDALLRELTAANVGKQAVELKQFLEDVMSQESVHKQLNKFTIKGDDGKRRFFIDESTKLEKVSPDLRQEIERAMGKRMYGATLQKIGWMAKEWNDDDFKVLDVAKRVGSGDGSFGVSRYYVLIAGTDTLVNQVLKTDPIDGVILDVKFVATPAVRAVLSEQDWPWYETLFVNEGSRVVEAQRRLTSYTDPYTGYVTIRGAVHSVRQRSPWKASLDFSTHDPANYEATVREVAGVTATSHVRATVGNAPVRFKDVIGAALSSTEARAQWGAAVARTAAAYRKQVLLDFECFKDWVEKGSPLSAFNEADSFDLKMENGALPAQGAKRDCSEQTVAPQPQTPVL